MAGGLGVSLLLTYVLLRLTQQKHIPSDIATDGETLPLPAGGRIAAGAIAMTGVVLLATSLRGWQLGFPTCVAGVTARHAAARMGVGIVLIRRFWSPTPSTLRYFRPCLPHYKPDFLLS